MKGLALSEAYYRAFGAAMIGTKFPAHRNRIAVGLAGLGSECFGFDDALSRDHDWGPGFCMWLDGNDYNAIGVLLQKAYDALPGFMGFHRRESTWGQGRVGVLSTERFYASFIGSPHPPETPGQWLTIPESGLAACTNGRVFGDPLDAFSSIRRQLLNHYPEDIRLKKIAAHCMTAAQSGQYNYSRSLRRNADYPAFQALAKFCEEVLALVFLLNRRYMPFYKWACRAASALPLLGAELSEAVENLIRETEPREKEHRIESICAKLIEALKEQDLSDSPSDFLLDHGPRVHSRIRDEKLKRLDIWWPGA
ncbi:MAG: DUF4037 domain-containing protein [Pseudomonadota bacterium]